MSGEVPAPSPCRVTAENRRKLVLYFTTFLAGEGAYQVSNVAIAWHIFTLHHRPFDLGLVGLTLFLPAALLVLVTGLIADRHDRKRIMLLAALGEIAAVIAFLALVLRHTTELGPYLGAIALLGTARAFGVPAERGILIALVPEVDFVRITAAYGSTRQLISVGGPAAGGALVALGVPVAFAVTVALLALSVAGLLALPLPRRALVARATDAAAAHPLHEALGGLRFIRDQPIVLAAITLDLFAVLFGGATAMLPAYADTILRIGPVGLGLLRAAPSVGAFASAAYLSRRPPANAIGRTLLVAVAVFGAATVVFGLSRSLWLSLVALAITGAADMISVVIRVALVQLTVTDAMRGRVNAVENVFIGASNELGEFESGTLAALVGVVPSVVIGGLATLAVVGVAALAFPQLRAFDRFAHPPQPATASQGA